MMHLKQWIADMPPEQHGAIAKRGTHTALLKPLALLEKGKHRRGRDDFQFFGNTDLSKACDRVCHTDSIDSFKRMGVPQPIQQAIAHNNGAFFEVKIGDTAPHSSRALPQGDPASPLGLMSILSESLCRLQQKHRNTRFTVYLDDRSWISKQANECVAVGRSWVSEIQRLRLINDDGKTVYGAPSKRQCNELSALLANLPDPNNVTTRPKSLGTYINMTKRPQGPTPSEIDSFQTSLALIRGVRHLPITDDEKLAYAKATGLAKAKSNGWSRLPSLQQVSQLRTAMAYAVQKTYSLARGPLQRLFSGHTADPIFVLGARQVTHILNVYDQELHECWANTKSAGPISLLRSWMARLGWVEQEPWKWHHAAGGHSLTAGEQTGPALLHLLRDAWRAHLWHSFTHSRHQAAQHLSHLQWRAVEPRFNFARQFLTQVSPLLKPHVRSIFQGHWVSQARFYHTQQQPVPVCKWCGDLRPGRHHEWRCPQLRQTADEIPNDALFEALGWPREGGFMHARLPKERRRYHIDSRCFPLHLLIEKYKAHIFCICIHICIYLSMIICDDMICCVHVSIPVMYVCIYIYIRRDVNGSSHCNSCV